MNNRYLLAAVALFLAPGALPGQQIQFVEVEPGVRLEVVDWGGSGRAIVLLAGGGDTAHVYDQFAPKLTTEYHVLGITRRGFGASSKPTTGYTAEGLANDVLHVLEALKLERPVLVGHSVAGEEMSSIGARCTHCIAGLIYLDAAWDRTYVMPPGPKRGADFDTVGIPEQPKPDPKHFDPQQALVAGVQKPEYGRIHVPALAIYAAPRTWREMAPEAPEIADVEKRAAAERVVGYMARTRKHMEDTFRSEVANSRVIEIPGASHYVFQTNEADVLREIRTFFKSLAK